MCGIAGLVAPGRSASDVEVTLRSMVATLEHRGPDSEGHHVVDGVGIGMRRLSIIDLSTGDQPISNEAGDVWVIQNGEIYNYRELRAALEGKGHRFRTGSDTEVLVHGWEEWGEAILDQLNGMFAFAVWDSRIDQLFIARDRMGIKPLYWSYRNDVFLFGSELKALLASQDVDETIDDVALGQYLVFEYVPAPRSIVRGVQKLPAGSCLTLTAGAEPRIRKYWDLRFEPDRAATASSLKEETLDALERSTRMELVSDVPIGILLSGGIDSSAVAMAASRSGAEITTFSVGFDDRSFDESSHARSVATFLGSRHHEQTLKPEDMAELCRAIPSFMDEPLADSSLVPTFLLSRFTREHVKVALGGDGGDELWAGYPTMLAHRVARTYRKLPQWLREGVIKRGVELLPPSFNNLSLDFKMKRFVQGAELIPELQHQVWLGGYSTEGVRRLLGEDRARDLPDEKLFEPIIDRLPLLDGMEPMDRLLYLDASLYLEGDILTKVDRASMACSLEVRVPLLNREFVDVARRVPFELKLQGRKGKSLLRDAVSPFLPPDISRRSKKGFNIPVSKWLAGPQRSLLDDLENMPSELFVLGERKRLIQEHVRGVRDNRKLLWPLVVFGLWQQRWASAPSGV